MTARPVRPPMAVAVPAGRTALRPSWEQLPAQARAVAERALGSRVVGARGVGSGYTAGFAAVVTLQSGEERFVKAASREQQPLFHRSYAREADVSAALPAATPAPRLLGRLDEDGWLVLVFEALDGRTPVRPWVPEELDQVLVLAQVLADVLTPAPATVPGLLTLAEDLPLEHWRRRAGGTSSLAVPDRWNDRIDDLALLESGWVEATAGSTMAHLDLRDDNVLLAGDVAYACDWNWPALCAPWVDVSALLVSAYGDGYDATALLRGHPAARGTTSDAVDAWLAALGGFYLDASQQAEPDPPSPWLRTHQRWYAAATLDWLAERRGW